jgi:hypothetical protein
VKGDDISVDILGFIVKDSVKVEDLANAIWTEMLNSNGEINTIERTLRDVFGLNRRDTTPLQVELCKKRVEAN